jgi:hypothetical protein
MAEFTTKVFQEADGWHWCFVRTDGMLDSRGRAYATKEEAEEAAREAAERAEVLAS